MNKHKINLAIERFHSSFKQPKLMLKTVIWDLGFFAFVILLFFIFSSVITILSSEFVGLAGTDIETILSELSTEELDSLFSYIRNVLVVFTVGLIFVTLAIFAGFSYSRKKVWALIMGKDFLFNLKKDFFKGIFSFIGLGITLFVLFFLGLIPILIIQNIVSKLIFSFGDFPFAAKIISQAVSLFFFVILLQLFFSIKKHWSKEESVWSSIGNGFSFWFEFVKDNLSDVLLQWTTLVLALLVILQILIKLFPTKLIIMYIFQVIIYLLFLSWSRLYFVNLISNQSHKRVAKTKH